MELVLVDPMHLPYCLQQSSCQVSRIFRALGFRKQHDEFVAPLPTDSVRTANAIYEAICDRLKKFVADRMPQRVVYLLEPLEVQEQDRDFSAVTAP
jgi:hypothetical protein